MSVLLVDPTSIPLHVAKLSVRWPACQPLKPSSLSMTATFELSPSSSTPIADGSATGSPLPWMTIVAAQFVPAPGRTDPAPDPPWRTPTIGAIDNASGCTDADADAGVAERPAAIATAVT